MRAVSRDILFIMLLFSVLAGPGEAASGQLGNLTEVGTFTTHDPYDAQFYKDHLYIADGDSIQVYNTSDPERPKPVMKFTDFDEPPIKGLSISEDKLFVAAGAGWIYIINISDPENPKKSYKLDYLDYSNDVAVSGEYMYVADANTGLLIFDLYNRMHPSLAGMFYIEKSNASGSLQGWGGISVEVSGNYAFLSGAYNKGFYIIDISNKTQPRSVYHSPGKNVYNIAVSGNDVYLARADGTADFEVYNISNIYAPEITGSFSIYGTAGRSVVAIHPSGNYIYAASDETWHIFLTREDLPPQITIEEPGEGEIFTSPMINISGTASDRNGIDGVFVGGKFAGTASWHQTVMLAEGTNMINITAFDKEGNYRTEILQVTYRIPRQTVVSTPEIRTSVSGTEVIPSGRPVVLNIIYVAFAVIILIVIVYLILKHGS